MDIAVVAEHRIPDKWNHCDDQKTKHCKDTRFPFSDQKDDEKNDRNGNKHFDRRTVIGILQSVQHIQISDRPAGLADNDRLLPRLYRLRGNGQRYGRDDLRGSCDRGDG